MSTKVNPLQKQLEEQRFLHGIAYVQQAAGGIKKLSGNELAYLNTLLIGHTESEPWRFEAIHVQIPSGKLHHFNIVSNPIAKAREIIGTALEMMGTKDPFSAAFYLYTQLVLEHLFTDANRRTAVLAVLWLLQGTDLTVDAAKLLKAPIGDLRDPGDFKKLELTLKKYIC